MENNYERIIKNEKENNDEDFQDGLNQNNKDYINQEGIENDQVEEVEEDDDRLTYTLITLDLGNLIHIFEDNNISFVDMLLLSKEDLIELQLEIFQRNRILNFSKLFTKYAKNYSIREISDFFTFNKQFIFNSSIYDKVFNNSINAYDNENENTNYNLDNNYEQINQEINYINTNPNLNDNQNTNNNIMTRSMQYNPNANLKLNNQAIYNKTKDSKNKSQNINGGMKKNKNNNNSTKNNNVNNDLNQDNNFHNKFLDSIKNRKTSKLNEKNNKNRKNNKNQSELKRNEEYQKIIEKIGLLENSEMNYDLYTKLNLIKTYINNKGDRITLEDIMSINNDIDSMIEILNLNLNYKNEIGLNNNEVNKKKNKIKVVKK